MLDTSVGNVRIGQFKEPFSLELQTSTNDTTFMERATLFNLTPDRNTGLMVYDNPCERVTWAAGVFRDSDKFGDDSGDGEYNYTGRITGLPPYVFGTINALRDQGRPRLRDGAEPVADDERQSVAVVRPPPQQRAVAGGEVEGRRHSAGKPRRGAVLR